MRCLGGWVLSACTCTIELTIYFKFIISSRLQALKDREQAKRAVKVRPGAAGV